MAMPASHIQSSVPAPRTAYGRTKLAGERAVLEQPYLVGYVVRTAWLYGAHGSSFVRTMISKARDGDRDCGECNKLDYL